MRLSKLFATGIALASLAAPVASFAQEPKPGEWKIPGTETTIKLNGFVEVDGTYDFSGADEDIRGSDWASFLAFQPLDDDADQDLANRLYLTSRTSRVGLTTSTPTGWGALVVRVEGDFNSPSPYNYSTEATTNGTGFRLRHGYGEIGGLLIGQTWSTFDDLGSFPDTVDFNGHGAFGANRRPMVRYTLPIGAGSLALAVENPQSLVTNAQFTGGADNNGRTTGRLYDRVPEVVANVTMPFGAGHVSARAVAMEYRGTPAGAAFEREDSKWGYAGALSGSLKFGAETLVVGVQAGDGLGLHNFQSLFQGAAFTAAGEIDTWKAVSYHVGLTHAWTSAIRSNVVWSQTFLEDDDELTRAGVFGTPYLVNKRVDAGYVNTFVAPVKNVEFGLEYSYGQRKIPYTAALILGDLENDTGTQHRANALARFTFF